MHRLSTLHIIHLLLPRKRHELVNRVVHTMLIRLVDKLSIGEMKSISLRLPLSRLLK